MTSTVPKSLQKRYRTGDPFFDTQYGGIPRQGVFMFVGDGIDLGVSRTKFTTELFRHNKVNVYSHVSCARLAEEFNRQYAAISGLTVAQVRYPQPVEGQTLKQELHKFALIESREHREYSFSPLSAHPQAVFVTHEPLTNNRHPWITAMAYEDHYLSVLRAGREKVLATLRSYAAEYNRLVILFEDRVWTQPTSRYESIVQEHGQRYQYHWIVDLTEDDPFSDTTYFGGNDD